MSRVEKCGQRDGRTDMTKVQGTFATMQTGLKNVMECLLLALSNQNLLHCYCYRDYNGKLKISKKGIRPLNGLKEFSWKEKLV